MTSEQNSVNDNIAELIKSDRVFIFMKGSKDIPQCGFSSMVVNVFNILKCKFTTYNVLDNDEIRQAIKEFSQWPTIPQIYIDGEFIGGCDIAKEMFEDGSLKKLLSDKKLV